MSVREGLLNDKEVVFNEISSEEPEHTHVCSFTPDDLENVYSFTHSGTR